MSQSGSSGRAASLRARSVGEPDLALLLAFSVVEVLQLPALFVRRTLQFEQVVG